MPEPKEKDDDGLLDNIKDFLNRPLWGTGRDEDEAAPPAAATTPRTEVAPKVEPGSTTPAAQSPPLPKPQPAAPPAASAVAPSIVTTPTPVPTPIPAAPAASVAPAAPPAEQAAAPAPAASSSESERIRELERRIEEMSKNAKEASREQAPPQRTYTVAYGDSLSKIAQRFYGDMMQWRKIYDANRDQINNPDLIHPGQVLVIP